jgi:hypothetical protein
MINNYGSTFYHVFITIIVIIKQNHSEFWEAKKCTQESKIKKHKPKITPIINRRCNMFSARNTYSLLIPPCNFTYFIVFDKYILWR